MPIKLPKKIETPRDIVRFFLYLDRVDHTSFHPDDRFWSPEGGVEYSDSAGFPAYTPAEAKLRDRLMKQAWKVANKEGLDIYEISLVATGNAPWGPVWIREAVTELLTSGSRKYWDPG